MKTIILPAAVDTVFFPVYQTDPVASRPFMAFLTDNRVKNPCLFRQGNLRLFHIEKFLRLLTLQVLKGFLPHHPRRPFPQYQAYRLSRCPVIKGESLFPCHMKQKVSLPYAASQDHLDGIHSAGVIFRDTD